MKHKALAIAAIAIFAFTAQSAEASRGCSVKDIVGKWIFATGIGRQSLTDRFPPDKDITAIGTMNIYPDGSVEGDFDVTVEDAGFNTTIPYFGNVIVNADCTGTLTFTTGVDTTRIDSIAIVSRREILGMSQDPANLWTYQVRRIAAGLLRNRRDED